MKETNIEEKTKKLEQEEQNDYLTIINAEVLEEGVYKYTMISNVPFMINETLQL